MDRMSTETMHERKAYGILWFALPSRASYSPALKNMIMPAMVAFNNLKSLDPRLRGDDGWVYRLFRDSLIRNWKESRSIECGGVA